MHIIKLNAIDSTNTFLKQLSAEKIVEDFTVVVTERQLCGRGQMGTEWISESGKNLIFSVFKNFSGISVSSNFYLSMAVSLAVFNALKSLGIENLSIKWPNDILSEDQKICGILIENVIKKHQIVSSIIGIGVNVNQQVFSDLPKATSMALKSGNEFKIDSVLDEVLRQLQHSLLLVETKSFKNLKQAYENELFRKDCNSSFKEINGNLFDGYIKGVTDSGLLKVLDKEQKERLYELKEVQLIY